MVQITNLNFSFISNAAAVAAECYVVNYINDDNGKQSCLN